ncbi:T9SS type A sorting domain-containing protein [Chitinophagaceae bacterium MMS25-I14]
MKQILIALLCFCAITKSTSAQSWSELNTGTLFSNTTTGTSVAFMYDTLYVGSGTWKKDNNNWVPAGLPYWGIPAAKANGNYYFYKLFIDSVARWNVAANTFIADKIPGSLGLVNNIRVATDSTGTLYVSGSDSNNNNTYIAKWTGSSWSRLDSFTSLTITYPYGFNYTVTKCQHINALVTDRSGNLYAACSFWGSNGAAQEVMKWNGSNWQTVGGTNGPLDANADINYLICDSSDNIYAAGAFGNSGGRYVAKWDGSNWSSLGTLNANNLILSLTEDNNHNLYTAGWFTNSNGKYYVAKWDGNSWSEIGAGPGALNANGPIYSVAVDNAGVVYAGGMFTNAAGHNYVARYGASTSVANISHTNVTADIFPNPATQDFTLTFDGGISEAEILISNILGEAMIRKQIISNGKTIREHFDISQFPAGAYAVLLKDKSGVLAQKMLIKQ